jgi:WXG100 family type VII secretion target
MAFIVGFPGVLGLWVGKEFLMANVNVSYAEMEDAASRLRSGQGDIELKLGELQSLIGGLVSNGFVTDQASVRFNESFMEFTSSAKKVVSALTDMGNYLSGAATTLQNADEQLAAALG